jgi:hypothetical protein
LQSGVNSTPTFYVNGVRHDDEHTFDALVAALQRVPPGHVGEELEHPRRP